MISNTRRKLSLTYSLIIGLLLLIMAFTFYWVLSDVIRNAELARLDTAGQQVVEEWLHSSSSTEQNEPNKEEHSTGNMEWEYLQSNQFALIADSNWLIVAKSPQGYNPFLEVGFQQQVSAQKGETNFHLTNPSSEKRAIYSIQIIPTNDKNQNMLFIGEDVTSQMDLLEKMRWLLILFTFLLLVVASFMGHLFAGRAMVPINRSFIRQQKFTAYASHELRTPLSVLQSSVEILEEQKNVLPPVHQTVLQHMKEEIQRMSRLTEQLLMLARSDSYKMQIRKESFALQQSFCLAAEKMKLIANEKRVTIRLLFEPSDEILYIGDADQINQLLYILMDNAIKYSYEGGLITLGITRRENGEIELFVTDEGLGIPEKDIPHLFERFYRVDQARTREEGGTGLGLAIAHEIVSKHGGSISVVSTIHQGSTFTVLLPGINHKATQLN